MTARVWQCQAPGCESGGIQTTSGRLKKWCSERCRRGMYPGDPCVTCGQETASGKRGNAKRPEPQCAACELDGHRLAAFTDGRERLISLYAAGFTLTEIATTLGLADKNVVSKQLHRLREYGYDIPYRRAGVSEKNRAAWAERKAA